MRGVPNHVCRDCGRKRQRGEKWTQCGIPCIEYVRMTEAEIEAFFRNPWRCRGCMDRRSDELFSLLRRSQEIAMASIVR